jgi:hypothetical protein
MTSPGRGGIAALEEDVARPDSVVMVSLRRGGGLARAAPATSRTARAQRQPADGRPQFISAARQSGRIPRPRLPFNALRTKNSSTVVLMQVRVADVA